MLDRANSPLLRSEMHIVTRPCVTGYTAIPLPWHQTGNIPLQPSCRPFQSASPHETHSCEKCRSKYLTQLRERHIIWPCSETDLLSCQRPDPVMDIVVLLQKLVALTLLFLIAQEVLRRRGKWFGWCLFFVIPILLSPYWFQHNTDVGLFPWLKLYTIAFSVSWLTALRFTAFGERAGARLCMLLLLVFNIVEALAQDAFGGHLAHYLVLLSGILLIFTLPRPLSAVQIDIAGPYRDLHFRGMTRTWIVEYTAWNGVFLFLNFPFVAGYQFAVLGAALLVGLYDPQLWLQARGYTLGISLLLLATFREPLLRWTDTSHWTHPDREDLAAAVCLGIAAGYTYRYFFQRNPTECVDIGTT